MSSSNSSSVKVLERAFAIMDQLRSNVGERSMSDLARSVDLPVATVYRILGTLERHGYASRNVATRRYVRGPRLEAVHVSTRRIQEIANAALPVMAMLGRKTEETVLLSCLNSTRDRSICMARVESPLPLRLEMAPGTETPLYLGALQLILFAFLEPIEIKQLLAERVRPATHKTITDPGRVHRRLARIRSAGHVWISEETNLGVAGLAVPLFDPVGRISLGLGIAGPSNRLTAKSMERHLFAIRSASKEIANRLDLRTWEQWRHLTDGRMRLAACAD